MRKLFFLLVAISATSALWAYDFEVNGIYYNYLDGNNVEVTNSGYDKYLGEITIPETLTFTNYGSTYSFSVTSIGDYAFSGCSSLTSVTIPNSVTSIGYGAFDGCSSLTSITIPNSVMSIGDQAFYNCSSLTSITVPENVTSIGNYAFYGCSSLTSLTIPNSVTSIGNSAFSRCSSLTSITIPNSVTSIGDQAFYNCSSLTSLTIPNSVESIGWGAFQSCISLISITIPNSVTTIGTYAFDGCSALTSMIVENGNTIYDSRENCNAIIETATNTLLSGCQNTIIPNSVTSIESSAFSGCSSLTSIIIPNSVTSIVNNPFEGCYGLSSIVVESGNHTYDSRENCNAIIETKSNTLIAGCQNTVIPNSVTSIGNYAFYGCSSLTSITIPNSVTSIGNWAFYGCSSITSITIPHSVTSIGKLAFFNCTSLTSISLPNNLTNIGDRAFINTPWLQNQPEGLLYFGDILYTYVGAIPEDAEIVIKEGTTKIAGGAFMGGDHNNYTVDNITSFTFPQSIKFIGENAFSSSIIQDSLKINYLGNMENWCDIVFENSSANPLGFNHRWSMDKLYINNNEITELVIPNTIDSIHDYSFYGYMALTSVTIPRNVKFIGREAFYDCGIQNVYLQSSIPPTLSKKSWKNFNSNPVCYIPCGAQAEYAASDWAIQVEYFEEYYPYSLSIASSNEDWGTVEEPTCEGGIIVTATPKIGYKFVTWSDGNTDNPRKLELTQDTTLVAEFAQSFSGQCGDNLYWSYDEGSKTISISGTGNMYDYTPTTQPWILFKEELKEVAIANTATSLGKSAFAGSIRLAKVEIGANVENIADSVFAGCNRLYHVYCYPTYPPFAEQSSFANYNVYLHVPCEEKEAYELDMIWGNFKNIECIGAESENITTDDVIVSPSTDNVTITWPTEENADTYSIVIEKDNEVFCTLTFNADGLLLNIAFAPARNGNHHAAQYAAQTAQGLRFTVTGLEEATTYAYNITAKDASDKTIKSHSGEFTTQSNTSTDVDNLNHSVESAQKLFRDGQLLILRDGRTYSVMGQEME